MKVRGCNINGKRGFCADLGKRDGKRRRLYFGTLKEANDALRDAKKESAAVGRRWAYLAPEKRAAVIGVLAEVEAAGLTLQQVWDGYRKAPTVAEEKSIANAIAELAKAKRIKNLRDGYIDNLESYLTRWSRGQEARPISAVTLAEVERYLDSLTKASRPTGINRLSTLFSFAVRKGWRTENPCDRIEKPRTDDGKREIFTIDEATKALKFCLAELKQFIPWLVLGTFGGIRPEEADKIEWKHIDLDRGVIRLDASVTKVRRCRTLHLKPVAVQWLRLGGTLPLKHVTRKRYQHKVRTALGWTVWKKDVTRHSAASYWCASDQNYAKVAAELGTSEKMLRAHYVDAVHDDEAAKFWNLTPATVVGGA